MKKEKLQILYEDKYLIAVNKKSNMLCIASDKEKEKTLYHEVREYLWQKNKNNRTFIIHRLDKDTSGIVLFAKDEKVKKIMQDNWDKVKREYYSLVHGTLTKKTDTLKSYLLETSTLLVYESKNKEGKLAITSYEVIKENNNLSLLHINILTGRKNQIRVQLSSINHPIVGDRKYGKKDGYRTLGLHAYKMTFNHPITNKEIVIETKIPNFMNI